VPEPKETQETQKLNDTPLVFISHDSRDAELAEAFSKLLKSVSAGMLKSFRSSDKKGTEGIAFGEEWYKTLMSKLDSASDVVCLLTERSLDRPWLLYETGVAKGKLGTPVHGIALGIPLNRASAGPFFHFQNSDDSEDSLAKLVLQLCRRISNLEPDQGVVVGQVKTFKASVAEVLKTIGGQKKVEKQESIDEDSVAKVLEEMKLIVRDLPQRFEQRIYEGSERSRTRRFALRRFHPMMIEEMSHMIGRSEGDPIGILIIASLVRDDFPWLYELGLEAYRATKGRNIESARESLKMFMDATEATFHGPLADMGFADKESHMMMREFPMFIHHYVERVESGLKRQIAKRSHISRTRDTKEHS
jgi:hypothetical protein